MYTPCCDTDSISARDRIIVATITDNVFFIPISFLSKSLKWMDVCGNISLALLLSGSPQSHGPSGWLLQTWFK